MKLQEEYGNDWIDKPVCSVFLRVVVVLTIVVTERSIVVDVG